MALDLIKLLAQKDGISALPKIDPNTQDISPTAEVYADKLSQAAIPAVLVGLYKYTRDEHKAENILEPGFASKWREEIFGNGAEELVSKIVDYSGGTTEEVNAKLDRILNDSILLIKENIDEEKGISVKKIFTESRTNILSHLPAAIGVGELLNDNSLDDRTNKMQGPVSNLMHKIQETFAGTENPEDKEGM